MAERIAIVTGAGSGIGRACAVTLQDNGYHVVLAGRRMQPLEETAALARPGGGRMQPVACDVTDPASVNELFDRTLESFGRLDVLFNNAGNFPPPTPPDDISFAVWQAAVAVNLTGAFLCAQAAYRMMKSQDPKGGRIINNGSISAQSPRLNSLAYTTTKHAITGLTKSLSLDGRAHGIACSQIDIGNAATDMTTAMAKGFTQADGSVRPEPRMDVKHVADAVLYMANLPLTANVQFITVLATAMPFIGRG